MVICLRSSNGADYELLSTGKELQVSFLPDSVVHQLVCVQSHFCPSLKGIRKPKESDLLWTQGVSGVSAPGHGMAATGDSLHMVSRTPPFTVPLQNSLAQKVVNVFKKTCLLCSLLAAFEAVCTMRHLITISPSFVSSNMKGKL